MSEMSSKQRMRLTNDGSWIMQQIDSLGFVKPSQLTCLYRKGWTLRTSPTSMFVLGKKGLKTLYYVRSAPARRAENLNSKVERMYLEDQECLSCQA